MGINPMPNFAIFGTWRSPSDDPLYVFTYQCARIGATLGWNILTGGYTGVMDAGLKGAEGSCVDAIAYTWNPLDDKLPVSQYAKNKKSFDKIADRLGALTADADACLVMPGRTGTVAELALAVESRSKGELACPVMVYKNYWDGFFSFLNTNSDELPFPKDISLQNLFVRVFSVEDVALVLKGFAL